MFKRHLKNLRAWVLQEDGAVTADMVMLTAGAVAMAIAAGNFFSPTNYAGPVGYWVGITSAILDYVRFN
jgi:hypothetical protein